MKRKSLSLKQKAELDALAQSSGFTARQQPLSDSEPPVKIDGRKLRSKGRTKPFNMAVKPETHIRFWTMKAEMEFAAGEELLIHLMDMAEQNRR